VGLTGRCAREFSEIRTSSPSRFFLLTPGCRLKAPQPLPSKGWQAAHPAMPFASPCHAPSAQGWQSLPRKRSLSLSHNHAPRESCSYLLFKGFLCYSDVDLWHINVKYTDEELIFLFAK